MTDLLSAVALLLVLEGVLPAASPGAMRRVLLQAAEMDDGSLRKVGLFSMAAGALLLYWVRG